MSHIEDVKNRLGGVFLRDRGNVDEQTVALVQNDVRAALEQFFVLRECAVEITAQSGGEVCITVAASGRRAHREK